MFEGEVLSCSGVSRFYGDLQAVHDVSLSLHSGGVVVLVGPNGCGKTTLVEMLLGLRDRTCGAVDLLGVDPRTHRRQVAQHLGVALQGAALHTQVTGSEHLAFIAALFGQGQSRIDDVATQLGITGFLRQRFGQLSGGQQRRMLVAGALLSRPRLAILDEPTSGVDIESRNQTWVALRGAASIDGTAVLTTTHDLAEAEEFADRVVVMRAGRVIADAPPRTLVIRSGIAKVVVYRCSPGTGLPPISGDDGDLELTRSPDSVTVGYRNHDRATAMRDAWADRLDAVLERGPSLADAYLALSDPARVPEAAPLSRSDDTERGGTR